MTTTNGENEGSGAMPCSTPDEMFQFRDFANYVQFESLGAAVRRMDRIIHDWRDKRDEHIGSMICIAMGIDICDLADVQRKKRLGIQ